jgi:argininosuccinate lyase
VPIDQLALKEWQTIYPGFNEQSRKVFRTAQALAARKMVGSPNPALVRKQVGRWQQRLRKKD